MFEKFSKMLPILYYLPYSYSRTPHSKERKTEFLIFPKSTEKRFNKNVSDKNQTILIFSVLLPEIKVVESAGKKKG